MYAIFKDELFQEAKNIFQKHNCFESGTISSQKLINHQEENFRKILKHVVNGSSFYKKHFSHLTASDIDMFSLDKLNTLPFESKDDLRKYGSQMASSPLTNCWILFETTGTTGVPLNAL